MIPLTCPYCGGRLNVTMEAGGYAFGAHYEIPEAIECDDVLCGADWKPDGTPRTGPRHSSAP